MTREAGVTLWLYLRGSLACTVCGAGDKRFTCGLWSWAGRRQAVGGARQLAFLLLKPHEFSVDGV